MNPESEVTDLIGYVKNISNIVKNYKFLLFENKKGFNQCTCNQYNDLWARKWIKSIRNETKIDDKIYRIKRK